MNAEQLRNQRFDRSLDRVTKRERRMFRQETLERRKGEQRETPPLDRQEPMKPTKEQRVSSYE